MPRDLLAGRDRQPVGQSGPTAPQADTTETNTNTHEDTDTEADREAQEDATTQDARIEAIKHLHPYAALLGLSDVDSCLALEEATFPEHQRASREKVGKPSFTYTPQNMNWAGRMNYADIRMYRSSIDSPRAANYV